MRAWARTTSGGRGINIAQPPQHLASRGLVAFANPAGAGLPGARREVAGIAELFPAAARPVHSGAQATAARASQPATYRAARVAHYATPALTAPRDSLASAILLARGKLHGRDVLRLELGAELAVLSACRSGAARLARGESLRRAAMTLVEQGRWAAPHHWAAFVLHGRAGR